MFTYCRLGYSRCDFSRIRKFTKCYSYNYLVKNTITTREWYIRRPVNYSKTISVSSILRSHQDSYNTKCLMLHSIVSLHNSYNTWNLSHFVEFVISSLRYSISTADTDNHNAAAIATSALQAQAVTEKGKNLKILMLKPK